MDFSEKVGPGAREALAEQGLELVAIDRLYGGTIAFTLRLRFADGSTAVLKQSRSASADAWEIEADGLRALRVPGGPRVPEVLAVGSDFLLVEDVGAPIPETDDFWSEFGRRLATMHAVVGPRYGWHRDNLLGVVEQRNEWDDDGWSFFGEQRILRYFELDNVKAALTTEDLDDLERVVGKLRDIVPEQPPSLIHGDLWRSNVLAAGPDEPALCDPAVTYLWAEVDVAMLWCSGGVPDACFDAYQEIRPFEEGWEQRFRLLTIRENLSVLAHIGPDEGTRHQIHDALAPYR